MDGMVGTDYLLFISRLFQMEKDLLWELEQSLSVASTLKLHKLFWSRTSNSVARIDFHFRSNGKKPCLRKNICRLKNVVTLKDILNLWKCFVLFAYQSAWRKMNLKIVWDAQSGCNGLMKHVFNRRLTLYTMVYYSKSTRQRIQIIDFLW